MRKEEIVLNQSCSKMKNTHVASVSISLKYDLSDRLNY